MARLPRKVSRKKISGKSSAGSKEYLAPRETKYLKLHKISDEHEVKNVTKLFEEVIADTDVYEK